MKIQEELVFEVTMMNQEDKEYYVKETSVYQVFAKNRSEAIDKVRRKKKKVHQYSDYHITY